MKAKVISILCAAALAGSMMAGCGSSSSTSSSAASSSAAAEASSAAATEAPTEEASSSSASEAVETTASSSTSSNPDQAAADKVAALIDKIYVQERTDTTDEDCKAAKEAWDALTDTQKALVSGENADPEYFGRDTGDASADDPLNEDNIGENEILVCSFGTSFNDSRAQDIGGIEKAEQAAYPDWSVRRAFTAQIIINHVEARDGEYIDNMDQALQRAWEWGCSPAGLTRSSKFKHIFSHVEWHMTGYYITCGGCGQSDEGAPFRWVTAEEMEAEVPLPSAFQYFL